MYPIEIILYALTAISLIATLVGNVIHNKPATIGSFIFLVAVTVLWSVLELAGVFPK